MKTLSGRRRYLPKITAGANMHARAAAERQAINTAVQGSAADLVKAAMNKIERRVAEVFPRCRVPLRPPSRKLERPQGCNLMVEHRLDNFGDFFCSMEALLFTEATLGKNGPKSGKTANDWPNFSHKMYPIFSQLCY